MLDNLNWWEFLVLLLLALLIFGDRLPVVISDGLRMLRNLRSMARNATGDLSRELGTDIQLEDLHPKTFIRKHILSEADEEALRKPLRGLYDDLRTDIKGVESELRSNLKGVQSELKDVTDGFNLRSKTETGGTGTGSPVAPATRANRFDDDAT